MKHYKTIENKTNDDVKLEIGPSISYEPQKQLSIDEIFKAHCEKFKEYTNLVESDEAFNRFALVVGKQIEANLKQKNGRRNKVEQIETSHDD